MSQADLQQHVTIGLSLNTIESANAPLIVLLQFTIRLMDEDGTVVEEYQLAFRGPEGRTMTLSEFDENGGEVISLTVISTKQKL